MSPSIESLLKKYNIRARKSLGQNFLTAKPTIEKIIGALELKNTDTVLEIGAGLGVMTSMIAPLCHSIYAVEKDRTLFSIIEQEFSDIKNLHPICADILKLDFKKELAVASFPIKVIGNIPYNISTPILFKLIKAPQLFTCAVLTVQKEVAERVIASPGTKDYGIPSILLQTRARCQKMFDIKPTCFIPPPRVVSSVLHLDFEAIPEIQIKDMGFFEKLVKAAFGQRRKTVRNSLLGARDFSLQAPEIDEMLKTCRVDPTRRSETISIKEYADMTNFIISQKLEVKSGSGLLKNQNRDQTPG